MAKYILKRMGYMIFTLWVVATITFFLINAIPGDPVSAKANKVLDPQVKQAIMEKYNLDDPIYVRYGNYLANLAKGDLGMSIAKPGVKVNDTIKKEFPVSARLGIQAVVFGLIIGLILGIVAAFNRNTWVDFVVIFIALVGVCVPGFVLAILLQNGLGGKLNLKIAGWSTKSLFDIYRYSLLPTIALAMTGLASNARFMRTSVLDVINQDYILTAKSKGVRKVSLVWKHIIRNAILPVVTIIGPRIAAIITGSIVVESIFSIPGIGRELISSISNRDYTVVMSLTVFFAFLYMVSLLIVDIVYVLVDPRIKLNQKKG